MHSDNSASLKIIKRCLKRPELGACVHARGYNLPWRHQPIISTAIKIVCINSFSRAITSMNIPANYPRRGAAGASREKRRVSLSTPRFRAIAEPANFGFGAIITVTMSHQRRLQLAARPVADLVCDPCDCSCVNLNLQ